MPRSRFRFALTASLLLVLLSTGASIASEQGFSGKVIGVSDGDTITVLRDAREVPIGARVLAMAV